MTSANEIEFSCLQPKNALYVIQGVNQPINQIIYAICVSNWNPPQYGVRYFKI